jgi:hypothetical protein
MANDTGPHDTSANPPRPDPNAAPGAKRPPRLVNLPALLARENVDYLLVLRAKSVRLAAVMPDGSQDSKTLDVGDGCLLIVKLNDNPADVGGGFYEVLPPTPE